MDTTFNYFMAVLEIIHRRRKKPHRSKTVVDLDIKLSLHLVGKINIFWKKGIK